ncbi:hypothetical protein ILYODFUR_036629 [Ilyodon furcidens]|uniref:Uncharacterized protein n=1 Tax=Ilyodon furcidens TaxID=33524 RepID=A0ABV0VAX2_9TELE
MQDSIFASLVVFSQGSWNSCIIKAGSSHGSALSQPLLQNSTAAHMACQERRCVVTAVIKKTRAKNDGLSAVLVWADKISQSFQLGSAAKELIKKSPCLRCVFCSS